MGNNKEKEKDKKILKNGCQESKEAFMVELIYFLFLLSVFFSVFFFQRIMNTRFCKLLGDWDSFEIQESKNKKINSKKRERDK